MGAFHAYDIRGIYGEDFDSQTAYKVGYFIPGLLGTDKVAVGRDGRVSSPEIHDALVRGITDAGADVYDIGLSTTPMVYFTTAHYGFEASVQITASHNPPQYNGMKVSRANALPVGYDTGLGQIEAWIKEGRPTPVAAKKGKVVAKDIMDDYIAFLKGFKEDISSLKIVMDCSNGVAGLLVGHIFGDHPEYLNLELDGTFPAHDPNPLIPANVEQLCREVKKTGADVGVEYDGDADRVMFVDEKGQFISPDLIIAFLGNYFLKKQGRKGLVLQDIRSSKAVGEYLAKMGGKMATWKVGRAFAAPKLREIDGIFGGELAGHYYFKDFFYSDSGMLASLLVLNTLADFKKQGIAFSEVISAIASYRNSGEINFRVEDKKGAMDAVREYFESKEKADAVMDFDGYRVEFPKWWFNIRPSNTEPYLRFICEACDEKLLEEKIAETQKIICESFGGKRV